MKHSWGRHCEILTTFMAAGLNIRVLHGMKTMIHLNGFSPRLRHRKLMHWRPWWLLFDRRYCHYRVCFLTVFGFQLLPTCLRMHYKCTSLAVSVWYHFMSVSWPHCDHFFVRFVNWAAFSLVLGAETGASKSALEWILLHFKCVCVAVVILFSPFASLTVSLHVICSNSLTHHSILMSVSFSLLSPLLFRSFQFFYRSWGGIHFQSFPHSTCCRPCPPNCYFLGHWQPVLLDTS